MAFNGFIPADFAVFSLPGFEDRMAALKQVVRPKLEEIGAQLAPRLSEAVGVPMYAHVAKHARRTVNPPKDTWVAWSANARGYKAHPHFQVGLWGTHVFAQFAMIYEAPQKAHFARLLRKNLKGLHLPGDFVWSGDHTQPEAVRHDAMNAKAFKAFLERLEKVQKAEALCGIHLLAGDPLLDDGEALLARIEEVFQTTMPLYRMAQAL
ncbi:hypothetical protein D3C87_896250 [compost metagenome]